MFRAVIKNAGLEDQSTIFILEICFSYQEMQVSRPKVNSVTHGTVSLRNGLRLYPGVKQSDARGGEQRGGRGARRRSSRWRGRVRGTFGERCGQAPGTDPRTQPGGLQGPKRRLDPTGRACQHLQVQGRGCSSPARASEWLDLEGRTAPSMRKELETGELQPQV